MSYTKKVKECEVCGIILVGGKYARQHRRRHEQKKLRNEEEKKNKEDMANREIGENERREFRYEPEEEPQRGWNAQELEESLASGEVSIGFAEASDSEEVRVARVQVREELREEFEARLKRFRSDMKGTRFGELLREGGGKSEDADEMGAEGGDETAGTSTETEEEKKRRRGKAPMKKKRGLTEEKKKEGEEMLEWIRRLVEERGDMASADDLYEEACARYAGVGTSLYMIIRAMRIGMKMRKTVVETRTEVREVVRPVYIVMERGGEFRQEQRREPEEMSEEDEYQWAGREEEEREYREAMRGSEMVDVVSDSEEGEENGGDRTAVGEDVGEEDDDFVILSD